MEIQRFSGLQSEVFQYIGRYAMDMHVLNFLGNSITTDEKSSWFVLLQKDDNQVLAFCKLKETDKRATISCVYQTGISEDKSLSIKLVKHVISIIKIRPLFSFAANDQLPEWLKLGFEIVKSGKNWHNVKLVK